MTDSVRAEVSDTKAAPAGPLAALRMRAFTDHLTKDSLGGHRQLKLAWVINAQKGGACLFWGFLMWWYGNTAPAAWVYLALHGSYGLCWLLKDVTFPDPNWQSRVTFGGALMSIVGGLGLYWLIAWLLISGVSTPDYPLPEQAWFALCISLHTLGIAIMLSADAQKYYTLKVQRGLITTGMFRYVRHPNYLGEMMIYGSYALMVWHWAPVLILAWIWIGVFAVNMVLKEASMSRHPTWAAYKRRTGWLLPGL